MHERLTTKQTEESVSMFLCIGNGPIERLQIDRVFLSNIHPATLATEVAGVDDGDIEEWGEVFAPFDTALELLHRTHALKPKVPEKLPDAALVSGAERAKYQAREHKIYFKYLSA